VVKSDTDENFFPIAATTPVGGVSVPVWLSKSAEKKLVPEWPTALAKMFPDGIPSLRNFKLQVGTRPVLVGPGSTADEHLKSP